MKRHVKAQGEANPYDPAYKTYFDQRGQGRGMMLETFGAARTLRYLWLEPHGFCTVCKKKITRITGLRLHHCVSRVIS